MMAQVTAAALVSENKTIAVPCSVDSIPTSANHEDHVSMATHGARRLGRMVDNAAAVIGIELLAAAQRHRLPTGRPNPLVSLEQVHAAFAATCPTTYAPIGTSRRISRRRSLGSNRDASRRWCNGFCRRGAVA